MRLAYFGYAGDPSHAGHLQVIDWLADRYDKVLVGLSASHAFGKKMAPLGFRESLTRALLAQSKGTNTEIVTVEADLAATGTVYSYDVLVELRKQHPGAKIHLAIGPDNAMPETWARFRNSVMIDEEFGKIVAPDMGSNMRSTRIRKMLKEGTSFDALALVATPNVAKLLMSHSGYYTAP